MNTLDAFILGLVQGLAEYLPISSSGHLEIFREILGLQLSGAESLEFDVMLHVATVLSTIVVLWKKFVPLCKSFFTFRMDDNFWYVVKILVSCIPIAVVGFCFKDTIETFFGRELTLVGWCLLATAALLFFSYFFRTRPLQAGVTPAQGGYKPRDISFIDAFVIGCSQAVAVLPGLSRSGTTIATGILIGDKREQVAQFSFFMVIIPILGEALLDIKDMLSVESINAAADVASASVPTLSLIVGFITSFVVGCLACKWMLAIVNKGKLWWFAIYCIIAATLCLLYGYNVL